MTAGMIDEKFSREHLLEYTVEAGRPDSITEEKLKVIKSHGITRISINPQSMQQKTLDAIGRKHTVEEIKEAYALAERPDSIISIWILSQDFRGKIFLIWKMHWLRSLR